MVGWGWRSAKQLKAPGHDWEEAWADAEMLSSQVVSSLIKSAHPQIHLRVARTHTHTHPRTHTHTRIWSVVKGLSRPPLRAVSEVKRESAAPCSRIYSWPSLSSALSTSLSLPLYSIPLSFFRTSHCNILRINFTFCLAKCPPNGHPIHVGRALRDWDCFGFMCVA